MSPWLFNVYMDAGKKEVKIGMGRMGVRFLEEGRKWRLLAFLYAGELEEDLKIIMGYFVGV